MLMKLFEINQNIYIYCLSAGKAESRRAVSGTLLNDVSSRSHMILTLTVKAMVMSIAVQKLKILIRRNSVTFLY